MEMLLEYFNAKAGREDIFKLAIENESLHEISNDNGVGVVNFATSKNLIGNSKMFTDHNINLLGHFLMERFTIKLAIF
jgi:hypothetical protein